MRKRRPLLVALPLLLALLCWSGAASAQDSTEGDPAIDQYVDEIPTGGGSPGGQKSPAPEQQSESVVTPTVEEQIEKKGGTDRRALRKVVSSSVLGAPPETLGHLATGKPARRNPASTTLAEVGGGESRLPVLLGVLAAIAAGGGAAAAWRRKRGRA